MVQTKADSYASIEEKYEILNFNSPELLKKLMGWIMKDSAKMIMVSGQSESGKNYLVESAIYELSKEHRLLYFPVDLEDIDFLHQKRDAKSIYEKFRPADSKLAFKTFSELFTNILNLTISHNPLLAIFLIIGSFILHRNNITISQYLAHNEESLLLPERNFRETVFNIFDTLTGKYRVVLVINHSLEMYKNALAIFEDYARINTSFVPVLIDNYPANFPSCMHEVDTHCLYIKRYDLASMTKVICKRFPNNSFTDLFYHVVFEYSHGFPGQIALIFKDLLHAHVLKHVDGIWSIEDDSLFEEHITLFSRKIYDDMYHVLSDLEKEEQNRILTFFHYAALCGKLIPASLILQMIEPDDKKRDSLWAEIISRFSKNKGFHVFNDINRFEGDVRILRFKSNIIRLVILDNCNRDHDRQMAKDLLEVIKPHWPVKNRKIARLYYELNSYIRDEYEDSIPESDFWWIDNFDGENIAQNALHDIKQEKMSPEQLLQLISFHYESWNPLVIRKLLDVFQEISIPDDYFRDFQYLSAINFAKLGQYKEAQEIFETLYIQFERQFGKTSESVIVIEEWLGGLNKLIDNAKEHT